MWLRCRTHDGTGDVIVRIESVTSVWEGGGVVQVGDHGLSWGVEAKDAKSIAAKITEWFYDSNNSFSDIIVTADDVTFQPARQAPDSGSIRS